jgi:hypothetical protein
VPKITAFYNGLGFITCSITIFILRFRGNIIILRHIDLGDQATNMLTRILTGTDGDSE